jgi:hypothetical protein
MDLIIPSAKNPLVLRSSTIVKFLILKRSGPRRSIEHGALNMDLIIPSAKNPLSFEAQRAKKCLILQRSGPRRSVEHGALNMDLIIPSARNPLSFEAQRSKKFLILQRSGPCSISEAVYGPFVLCLLSFRPLSLRMEFEPNLHLSVNSFR